MIKEPITYQQKAYTGWQEAARKDVERAFGVLKSRWQFLERPIHLHKLEDIGKRVTCCLILHNICVSDYVMGDPRERYKPDNTVEESAPSVVQPEDLGAVQGRDQAATNQATNIGGVAEAPASVKILLLRKERFKELENVAEHNRLHSVLMDRVWNKWN